MVRKSVVAAAVIMAGIAVVAAGRGLLTVRAERARVVPAPALDAPAGPAISEVAVLAGGCFWGVQAVYQHVKGVTEAVSGYAGGEKGTAEYEQVGTGQTGHAESVQITFDPREITYGRLLQIYFSVAHDPTELNRQGPDVGPQYRSTIFPLTAVQADVARAYIEQLNRARAFDAAIATTIEPNRRFYPAEGYHQDFLVLNPSHPYIVINDLPKIENLRRLFPDLYRAAPVLVGRAR
ncbi:MAG TPA: peptide-methionine (S)-S-oxide reductase MsrA [Vicinamibacterales bacterium]|jgi:peptide-methionine (S)-S-oxide reductase